MKEVEKRELAKTRMGRIALWQMVGLHNKKLFKYVESGILRELKSGRRR